MSQTPGDPTRSVQLPADSVRAWLDTMLAEFTADKHRVAAFSQHPSVDAAAGGRQQLAYEFALGRLAGRLMVINALEAFLEVAVADASGALDAEIATLTGDQ